MFWGRTPAHWVRSNVGVYDATRLCKRVWWWTPVEVPINQLQSLFPKMNSYCCASFACYCFLFCLWSNATLTKNAVSPRCWVVVLPSFVIDHGRRLEVPAWVPCGGERPGGGLQSRLYHFCNVRLHLWATARCVDLLQIDNYNHYCTTLDSGNVYLLGTESPKQKQDVRKPWLTWHHKQ